MLVQAEPGNFQIQMENRWCLQRKEAIEMRRCTICFALHKEKALLAPLHGRIQINRLSPNAMMMVFPSLLFFIAHIQMITLPIEIRTPIKRHLSGGNEFTQRSPVIMQKKAALIVFRRPDCQSESILGMNVVFSSIRDK